MPIRSSTGFEGPAYTTDRPLDPRDEYAGVGDGASRPLSSRYGTLADAQVRYPHATSLTDELDWCAIQGVINASISAGNPATTTRRGIRPVLIPPGFWVLNKPLTVTSVNEFIFMGSGTETKFRLGAAGLAAMLDLNGISFSQFGSFGFADVLNAATNSCERVIWLHWDQATSLRSCSGNTFSDIYCRNINFTRAAVEIGDAAYPGVQVDNSRWRACAFAGDGRWHTATGSSSAADVWMVGEGTSANNLNHTFTACDGTMGRNALHNKATNVYWFGGGLNHAHGSAIFHSSAQASTYKGFRCEHVARLAASGGPSSAGAFVDISEATLSLVSADLAVDRRLIDWKLPGSLILTNISSNNPANDALTFTFNTLSPLQVTARGVAVHQRTAAQLWVPNANTRLDVRHVDVNAAGSVTGITTLESGVSGTTAQRPTADLWVGQQYFDSTLGKPIWWTGSNWRDATGTTV